MKDMVKPPPHPADDSTAEEVPHDPLSDALQRVLLAHTQAQGSLARSLRSAGSDVDALEHLVVEPLGPTELAQRLGITPAATTLVVDRLVARGHARRRRDPHDGRRTVVDISDAGRRTVLEHVGPMLHRLDGLAQQLSEQETAAVLAYLTGAAEALRNLAGTTATAAREPD